MGVMVSYIEIKIPSTFPRLLKMEASFYLSVQNYTPLNTKQDAKSDKSQTNFSS